MKTKHVIDADNQKIIDEFLEPDTERILEQYEQDGRWEDVSLDIDGDIILWGKMASR